MNQKKMWKWAKNASLVLNRISVVFPIVLFSWGQKNRTYWGIPEFALKLSQLHSVLILKTRTPDIRNQKWKHKSFNLKSVANIWGQPCSAWWTISGRSRLKRLVLQPEKITQLAFAYLDFKTQIKVIYS